jgi:hypothetical protein
MKSKDFPKAVQTRVILASRRRCALCFGLDGDTTEKEGQIAHVGDRTNIVLENAAWLCTKHHARYDSRSRQTKGHTPDELKAYRSQLYEYVAAQPGVWPDAVPDQRTKRRRGGISLEVHDRRIPVYRKTNDFVRDMLRGPDIELAKILQFAADTDEALFLFDEGIAEYLATLFKRAVRHRLVGIMRRQAPADYRTASLADEETQNFLWFSEQFQEVRHRFAPFLRIG